MVNIFLVYNYYNSTSTPFSFSSLEVALFRGCIRTISSIAYMYRGVNFKLERHEIITKCAHHSAHVLCSDSLQ